MAPVFGQEVIKRSVVSVGLLLLFCFSAAQAMDKRPSEDAKASKKDEIVLDVILRDLSFDKVSIEDVKIIDYDKKAREKPRSSYAFGRGKVTYKVAWGVFKASLFTRYNRFKELSILFVGNRGDVADLTHKYEGKRLNRINFPILKEVENLLKAKWKIYQLGPIDIVWTADEKSFCDVIIITEE